jgi:FKBP-type peptidyl-prolyl cis-trans isomerase FkpA
MRRSLGLLSVFLFASSLNASGDDRAADGETVVAGDIVLPSGLKYREVRQGTGAAAKKGDTVEVHYTGWLADGKKIDSSVDRGQPFTFALGAGNVIKGLEEGLAGMKVGGKRRITIPPELGYGKNGAGNVVPPNAVMIFEVELLRIK